MITETVYNRPQHTLRRPNIGIRRGLLTHAAIAATVLYLVVVVLALLREGAWPTPDFLIPPLVIIAVLKGRGWSFVIDWVPFLVLLLVYESFRGIADDLNTRVHVQSLIDADRWLTGGVIPTVWLQQRFFHASHIAWYDWVATGLHVAHFAVPVCFGFMLWLRSRSLYWRYASAVLAMFFAGFFTSFLYPAAPPWLASQMGYLPPVERVLGVTLAAASHGSGLQLAYQNFSPNPVAALPSLHAAGPLLVSLIALSLYGRRALPTLLYPLLGGLAWIYLGEHYMVDVLLGWVYALAAFVIFWLMPVWLASLEPIHMSLPSLSPSRLQRVPSWPLAAVMLSLGVYVWFHPLVHAPMRANQPVAAEAAIAGSGIATDIDGLELSDCGSSSLPSVPDGLLAPLAGEYSGFIQGLDSGRCFAVTANRSYQPLSEGELGTLKAYAPEPDSPASYLLPTSDGSMYVSVGEPSAALAGLLPNPSELYAVVVRVDQTVYDEAVDRLVLQIAQIALQN
jgi:hypothetical protein